MDFQGGRRRKKYASISGKYFCLLFVIYAYMFILFIQNTLCVLQIRACIAKKDGMPAIAIYLPRLATFIKFNPKAIKRWISKVGGDIKITEVMCATITADKIGKELHLMMQTSKMRFQGWEE